MQPIAFSGVPTFRIHDVELCKAFYVDFLGFQVDWEHFDELGGAVYMQVSRNGLVLHLSEHDRYRPETIAFVRTIGIEAFHDEIAMRRAQHSLPPVEPTPWGTLQLEIEDPFGNLLRFNESIAR